MFKCICGREFESEKKLNSHKPHCRNIIGEEEYKRRCKVRSEQMSNRRVIHKGNVEKRISKDLLDKYLKEGWIQGLSDEHKQKDREALTGDGNPMYGKQHTKETRDKISKSLTGLLVGEKNGMYGVDRSGETHCCYGRIKIYKDNTNSTCYLEEFEELEKQGWKRGVCKRTREITSQNTIIGQAKSANFGEPIVKQWKTSYFRDQYLRSSYEAFFVIYALWKGINFEFASHHPLTMKNGDKYIKNYFPDFYLPDTNTIVETNNGMYPDRLVLREEIVKSNGYNWRLILGEESDEEYYELLSAGINVDELWRRLCESEPDNRPHWDFINNKVIFLDKEE